MRRAARRPGPSKAWSHRYSPPAPPRPAQCGWSVVLLIEPRVGHVECGRRVCTDGVSPAGRGVKAIPVAGPAAAGVANYALHSWRRQGGSGRRAAVWQGGGSKGGAPSPDAICGSTNELNVVPPTVPAACLSIDNGFVAWPCVAASLRALFATTPTSLTQPLYTFLYKAMIRYART